MALQKNSSFSERLKVALEGHKNSEIADKIGISRQAISMYLSGTRHPVQPVIAALAKALDVSPVWLLGYDVDKTIPVPSNLIPVRHVNRVPLIGRIPCGKPILAVENFEDFYNVPDFVHADYCLRCVGDSMIDAHIDDGDIVFLKQQAEVEDGEIAAVTIGCDEDTEATLKKVYYGKETLTLMPANNKYSPIVYTGADLSEIHIIGKAVWLLSKLNG